MKKRSIVKMFILEIVTLGLYRLYWFVKTRRELMDRTKVKILSPWILILPILFMVIGTIFLVSRYSNTYSKITAFDQCLSDRGFPANSPYPSSTNSFGEDRNTVVKVCNKEVGVSTTASFLPSLLISLMFVAYLPLVALWLWKYCEAVEVVTDEKVSRILGLVLLLLIPDGIDILIMQDYFNKVPPAQGVPK